MSNFAKRLERRIDRVERSVIDLQDRAREYAVQPEKYHTRLSLVRAAREYSAALNQMRRGK